VLTYASLRTALQKCCAHCFPPSSSQGGSAFRASVTMSPDIETSQWSVVVSGDSHRNECSTGCSTPEYIQYVTANTALGSDGQGPSTRAAMRFTPATVT
jgi:hypothetical protein